MKTEILSSKHYDELLELLNSTFSNKYGRAVDFEGMWPRMWVRDDEHMSRHIAVFEGGKMVSVTGVYPLETHIGSRRFKLATTGNVATLPGYEGRGYFSATFGEAMRVLDEIGADAARLGGARQRYERYGYAPAGIAYSFTLSGYNARFVPSPKEGEIEFKKVEKCDTSSLGYIKKVYSASPIRIERTTASGVDESFLALTAQYSTPLLALVDGEPIGYLSHSGNTVFEIGAEDEDKLLAIAAAFVRTTGHDAKLTLPPYLPRALSAFSAVCDGVSIAPPSHFKIINYEGIADALLALKKSYTPLPSGELTLGIEGYGNLEFFVHGSDVGVKKYEGTPELTLSRLDATRFIFGLSPALVTPPPSTFASAVLPLPLSWNKLDCI